MTSAMEIKKEDSDDHSLILPGDANGWPGVY